MSDNDTQVISLVYLWYSKDEWTSDDDPESYKKKQNCTGPHFFEDILKYNQIHGKQCYFEDVDVYRVDYRALTKKQLNYYLFWRDRFWEGKMLTTCEGYLWILAHEIMICRSEPVSTYLLLLQLWDERKIDLEDPSLFIEFLRDYATLYNLPLPTEEVFGCNKNEMLVNNLSSFSPYKLENSVFIDLCGLKDYSKTEPSLFNRTMNRVLHRIYKYMKDEGSDMFSVYSDRNIEVRHSLFANYPLVSRLNVVVDSPNVYYSASFRKLVNDIAKYVSSLIQGLRPNDRPSTLSPELISLIEDGFSDENADEPSFKPQNTVTKVKIIDPLYIPRGVHDADPAPTENQNKSISLAHTIFDKNRAYIYGSRGMTERNWSERSTEPVEYTSSYYYNVSYDTMNVSQRSYYTYWKTNIMNGICLETDTGYIRMLTAEAIIFSDDAKATIEMFKLMRRFYGNVAEKFLTDTIIEYSLMHGIQDEDLDMTDLDVAMCIIHKCLSSDPIRDLPAPVIAVLLDPDKEPVNELDEITVNAFNQSVRLIDEARKELGIPGYLTYYNVSSIEYCAYSLLTRDYDIPDDRRLYSEVIIKRGSPLRGYLSQTMKLIESYIHKANGKKCKISVPKYHGDRTLRIIEKCVLKAIDDEAKRTRAKNKVTLDHNAIAAADNDLKAVTDMISTETDDVTEDRHEQEKTIETTASDDVWSVFISSLSEEMKEYLKAALMGKKESSAVAKRIKMTASKADDTINNAAMDSVGDTVIENGSVVEDYADDVKSHLK